MDFAKIFHSMCQIDAKEGTACFVMIAYAVHELSQKSGRLGYIPPPSSAERVNFYCS